MKTCRAYIVVLIFLCLQSSAKAEVSVRGDIYGSLFSNGGDYPYLRSRISIGAGSKNFDLHVAALYDHLNGNVDDRMYGGGLRVGNVWHVIIDGGYLERSYKTVGTTYRAKGHFGSLGLGYWFGSVGIYVPAIAKKISDGDLSRQIQIDIFPQLTLRAGI